MPCDTLQKMAYRACSRSLRSLTDIGYCPVALIQPLLSKIENPAQLRSLEVKCPQVIGHTKEAWLTLLKKHIPRLDSRLPPNWQETLFSQDNAERWWMVYKKLKKQVDREAASSEKLLAKQLETINYKAAATVIDRPRSLVAVGKNKYAKATYAGQTSVYKPGKTGDGPSFFSRVAVRSQTQARNGTGGNAFRPRLVNGVARAPASLVEELREKKAREAEQLQQERLTNERKRKAEELGQTLRPSKPFTSGIELKPHREGPKGPSPPLHGGNYNLTKDREMRLRNLKAGRPTANAPPSSSPQKPDSRAIAKLTADFLEDSDGDGDGYFGSSGPDSNHGKNNHNQRPVYSDVDGDDDDDLFDAPSTKPRSNFSKPVVPQTPVSHPNPAAQSRVTQRPATVVRDMGTNSDAAAATNTVNLPTTKVGPLVRKRKDPPTLFRPSKR